MQVSYKIVILILREAHIAQQVGHSRKSVDIEDTEDWKLAEKLH